MSFPRTTFEIPVWDSTVSTNTITHNALTASACGTTVTNATFSYTANGLKILTHDASDSVLGLITKGELVTSGFWKTSLSPSMEIDITTGSSLTSAKFNIGFLNAAPTTTPGEWSSSAEVTDGFGFYASGTTLSAFQVGTSVSTLKDTGITLAASTHYRLHCELGSTRCPSFYVDGVLVWASNVPLDDDTAITPFIHVKGNAKYIEVARLNLTKTWA